MDLIKQIAAAHLRPLFPIHFENFLFVKWVDEGQDVFGDMTENMGVKWREEEEGVATHGRHKSKLRIMHPFGLWFTIIVKIF